MRLKLKTHLKLAAEDWRKKYDYVGDFVDGLAAVTLNGKYGFVNKEGVEVVPPKYNKIHNFFHDGLASVALNGKWGFINKEGAEVVPPKYDYVGGFDEGFAQVGLKSKGKYGFSWGFINKEGEVVVPLKYDAVQDFKYNTRDFDDDLALVELNDRYGYINKKCEEVIPVKYTEKEIDQIPRAAHLLSFKLGISKKEALKLIFEEMSK